MNVEDLTEPSREQTILKPLPIRAITLLMFLTLELK